MDSLQLKTIITEKQLQVRVKEMGATLTDKFKNQPLAAICVLKGSFVFFSDLIRELDCDVSCEFIGLSSYGISAKSSGEVKLTMDLTTAVEGKHLLLVEDIVDTGLTMNYLQKILQPRNPASITTTTLLHKPEAKKVDCQLDLIGFTVPNEFVVGYGLDYSNQFRHLPYIARVENFN